MNKENLENYVEKSIDILILYKKDKEDKNIDNKINELVEKISIDCGYLNDYSTNKNKQEELINKFNEHIIKNFIKTYLEKKGITEQLEKLVDSLKKQGEHGFNILKDEDQRKLLIEFLINPLSIAKANPITVFKFANNSRGLNKGIEEMRGVTDSGNLSLALTNIIKEPVNFLNNMYQKYIEEIKKGNFSEIYKLKDELELKFKSQISLFNFLNIDKGNMNFAFSKIASMFIKKVLEKCKEINSLEGEKIKIILISQFEKFSENKTMYFANVISDMLKGIKQTVENSSVKITGNNIETNKNILFEKANECLKNPEECKKQVKPILEISKSFLKK